MSEPSTTVAGAIAFFKIYGLKVGFGMIGAVLLYFVLPPVDKDGRFDRKEFVLRLACAGFFSSVFGDWVIAVLANVAPWIQASTNTAPIYLLVGAPGWWISRAVAIWFHSRRGKDIGELYRDVKESAQ